MTISIILAVIAIVFSLISLGMAWTESQAEKLRVWGLLGWICTIIWAATYLVTLIK